MPETLASGACLARLEQLQAAYPGLPSEVIVKQELLTAGISVAAGQSAPAILALEGGPLRLRRALVRLRPNESSPYTLVAGEGALVLRDRASGELIARAQPWPRRPDYAAKTFPDGTRYADILSETGVATLPLTRPKDAQQLAEAAAETFVLQPWQTGELPIAMKLIPDPGLDQLSEAEQDAFLFPYVRALRERFGNLRAIMLQLPPRSWEGEQRLLEAGFTGRHAVMEIWDRGVFGRLGPSGLDWDTWVERLLMQPYLFMEHYSQPVLLVGKELSQPGGFADLDAARRATEQGIRFLVQHRVLVRPEHWLGSANVPVEYYLDLDQFWYETWIGTYRGELGGELFGPGRGRDPDGAFLDIGRGAPLEPRRQHEGVNGV
jgi:hypothetical protein